MKYSFFLLYQKIRDNLCINLKFLISKWMDNYKLCLLHTLLTFTVRTINVLIASIKTLTINHTQSSI